MVDVLAVGAHPDDIELSVGATLAAFARRGFSIALVHLTRGEAGTRGTPDGRLAEAAAAARSLNASSMDVLDLGDGRLADDPPSRAAIIARIRALRPRLLLAPLPQDQHPDHAAAGRLVKAAWYLAGIARIAEGTGAPFRPPRLWHFPAHEIPAPSHVIEVTEADLERKMTAIRCYISQFHDPRSQEPETRISAAGFLDDVVARMRYFGSLVGTRYAEPFHTSLPLHVLDPTALIP